MVDIASISATLTGLKTASDIATNLLDLKNKGDIQETAIKLNAAILEAQRSAMSAQSAQQEQQLQIKNLEDQITDLETWASEAERYELVDFGGETFAYSLKTGEENGEPPHHLCPACYQQRQKSILQFNGKNSFQQQNGYCPLCKTKFLLGVKVAQNWVQDTDTSWKTI